MVSIVNFLGSSVSFTDYITIGLSIITIIVTIYIPIRIMKFQRYNDLASAYRSIEFGHAQQCVIDFFYRDCNCDVNRIAQKYTERFNSDFEKLKQGKIEPQNVLHYQRRLLNNYYTELEINRKSDLCIKKLIQNEWTTQNADIVKIIVYMNKAAENNPNIFMDISPIKYERMPRVKGMSKYLVSLYNFLKSSKKWIK